MTVVVGVASLIPVPFVYPSASVSSIPNTTLNAGLATIVPITRTVNVSGFSPKAKPSFATTVILIFVPAVVLTVEVSSILYERRPSSVRLYRIPATSELPIGVKVAPVASN